MVEAVTAAPGRLAQRMEVLGQMLSAGRADPVRLSLVREPDPACCGVAVGETGLPGIIPPPGTDLLPQRVFLPASHLEAILAAGPHGIGLVMELLSVERMVLLIGAGQEPRLAGMVRVLAPLGLRGPHLVTGGPLVVLHSGLAVGFSYIRPHRRLPGGV